MRSSLINCLLHIVQSTLLTDLLGSDNTYDFAQYGMARSDLSVEPILCLGTSLPNWFYRRCGSWFKTPVSFSAFNVILATDKRIETS